MRQCAKGTRRPPQSTCFRCSTVPVRLLDACDVCKCDNSSAKWLLWVTNAAMLVDSSCDATVVNSPLLPFQFEWFSTQNIFNREISGDIVEHTVWTKVVDIGL